MADVLRDLKLEEFSIVRGDAARPANPQAVAVVYKSDRSQGEEKTEEKMGKESAPAPAGDEQTKNVIDKVLGFVNKAGFTFQSTTTEEFKDTDPVQRSQPTEPEPVAQAAPAAVDGDAVGKVVTAAVGKAIEPVVGAIAKVSDRVAALEKQPVASKAVAKSAARIDVDPNVKFPEFAKALSAHAGLTPGQKLTKAAILSGGWTAGLSIIEANEFLEYVINESVLLKDVRVIRMNANTQNFDYLGLNGKVFRKGVEAVDPGETVAITAPVCKQLVTKEIIAIVRISDDTVEDNIEGDAFVQHLLRMIAAAGANEIEQAAMHGDTGVPDANGILDRWDGWDKLARADGAHIVEYAADRAWPGVGGIKASELIKALPTKFRMNKGALRLIQHSDIYIDYLDSLAGLASVPAFNSITGEQQHPLKGVRNTQMPLLDKDVAFMFDPGGGAQPYINGTTVWLTNPKNLVLGVQREIRIESERVARARATDFVITMRADTQLETGDAVAIADHLLVGGEPSQ